MNRDEMQPNLIRSADVTTTPEQLLAIEDALDRLANLERLSASDGFEVRIARATGPSVRVADAVVMTNSDASNVAESDLAEPPVVLFRFTGLRAAAAIAFIGTVTAAWLAMQSGGALGGGDIEPGLDDWEQFASVSFPPLDYTSYDLFADTEQFTVSLTAEMIDSDPLFEEDSM
jgi:hypothetical protein